MSTRAQRKSNRRNAQLSTGPVTASGQAISSQNARTHGFSSAAFAIQSGENPQHFDQLVQSLTREMKAASEHEAFLVTLMAQARWKRTRIQALEMELLEKLLAGEPVEAKLALILRYAADAERAYYKAHRECALSRLARLKEQQADCDEAAGTLPPSFDSASFRKSVNGSPLDPFGNLSTNETYSTS